jgi:hypothetical protein
MQQWHGAVKISSGKFGPGTRQNGEHRNDEKMEKNCGKVWNETVS